MNNKKLIELEKMTKISEFFRTYKKLLDTCNEIQTLIEANCLKSRLCGPLADLTLYNYQIEAFYDSCEIMLPQAYIKYRNATQLYSKTRNMIMNYLDK